MEYAVMHPRAKLELLWVRWLRKGISYFISWHIYFFLPAVHPCPRQLWAEVVAQPWHSPGLVQSEGGTEAALRLAPRFPSDRLWETAKNVGLGIDGQLCWGQVKRRCEVL